MDCGPGEEHESRVGGCVPKEPQPYQLIEVKGTQWYWDPDTLKWTKPADATGGDSTRDWDNAVHQRIDRDFL